MKNFIARLNQYCISAQLKEIALNTEQTLDTSIYAAIETALDVTNRREDNMDELSGLEEADKVYDLGTIVEGITLKFPKARAEDFGFGLSYGLGSCTATAYGTGFHNAILPLADLEQPHFTAAGRFGKTIFKRRLASLFVDTLKATFAKDSWAAMELGIKGTGKYTDSITKEIVNAAYNATSLTLDANGVQGATAAERLDNVHRIRCVVPTTGEWEEVVYTAVSGATPAIITIEAPGGAATLVDYEILYAPTETGWMTFPAMQSESPLRVTNLVLKLGGKWDGADFLGGRTFGPEINSLEYNLNNQILVEFRIGGTGSYANYGIRQGRIQTIKLDRELRDFIVKQSIKDNEYFGVSMVATGAEFETGKNYAISIICPRCNIATAPIRVNGKFLVEAGDIKVLEDSTYGSVIARVDNLIEGYAQAV